MLQVFKVFKMFFLFTDKPIFILLKPQFITNIFIDIFLQIYYHLFLISSRIIRIYCKLITNKS